MEKAAQGGINGYGFGRNVYNLYDCAAEFMEDLDKRVTYEYATTPSLPKAAPTAVSAMVRSMSPVLSWSATAW